MFGRIGGLCFDNGNLYRLLESGNSAQGVLAISYSILIRDSFRREQVVGLNRVVTNGNPGATVELGTTSQNLGKKKIVRVFVEFPAFVFRMCHQRQPRSNRRGRDNLPKCGKKKKLPGSPSCSPCLCFSCVCPIFRGSAFFLVWAVPATCKALEGRQNSQGAAVVAMGLCVPSMWCIRMARMAWAPRQFRWFFFFVSHFRTSVPPRFVGVWVSCPSFEDGAGGWCFCLLGHLSKSARYSRGGLCVSCCSMCIERRGGSLGRCWCVSGECGPFCVSSASVLLEV